MLGIVVAILLLGLMILVHEFGHFTFAKIFKVPVKEFSLGMGKRIFSFIKNNTRYSIKMMPFGGSCAMVGEDPAGSGDMIEVDGKVDEVKGTVDFDGVVYTIDEIKKNNFSKINPIKKIIICISGPIFNFLLAFICATGIIFLTGVDAPVIKNVVEGSAATEGLRFDNEEAKNNYFNDGYVYSLQENDEIIKLETYDDVFNVHFSKEVSLFLYIHNDDFLNNKTALGVTVKRNGEILKTVIKPKFVEEENRVMIGISLGEKRDPKNVIEFLKYSFYEMYFYIDTTFRSLKMLFRGQVGMNEVSGPVGTVAVMGQSISNAGSATGTLLTIFLLVAMISSNLGVMNLIPLPALDGGRIVEAIIEMIIGRPLDAKIIGTINAITMILLLLLMFWIFGLDLYKIFSGSLLG